MKKYILLLFSLLFLIPLTSSIPANCDPNLPAGQSCVEGGNVTYNTGDTNNYYGSNPFNQSLNTSNAVVFRRLNVTTSSFTNDNLIQTIVGGAIKFATDGYGRLAVGDNIYSGADYQAWIYGRNTADTALAVSAWDDNSYIAKFFNKEYSLVNPIMSLYAYSSGAEAGDAELAFADNVTIYTTYSVDMATPVLTQNGVEVCLEDGTNCPAGSQTPWTSDIDGNGFDLLNTTYIKGKTGNYTEISPACISLGTPYEIYNCGDYGYDEPSCNAILGCSWSGTCDGTFQVETQNESTCTDYLDVIFLMANWGNVELGKLYTDDLFVSNNMYGDFLQILGIAVGNIQPYGEDLNLNVFNTGQSSLMRFGQDYDRNLFLGWSYDATPANAYAYLGSYGYSNAMTIDFSQLSLQTNSKKDTIIGGNLTAKANVSIGTSKFMETGKLGLGTAPSAFWLTSAGARFTGDVWTDTIIRADANKGADIGTSIILYNTTYTDTLRVNSTAYTSNLVVTGNFSAKRPYGMYSSTETQTIAVANTAYPVTFNWTEDAYMIDKSNDNANFSFQLSGDYLIELSAIVTTDLPNKHIEVWVQKNGVNVPRSNTKLELGTAGVEQTLVVPFILDMNTTDKFRVMYASDDAGTQLVYTTSTSYSPETPSIIMTISKISEVT